MTSHRARRTGGLPRIQERRVKGAYYSIKRTNTELRDRIDQLSALHRISLAMRESTTNPQHIWDMMLEEALPLFNADNGALYFFEGDDLLRVQACKGENTEKLRDANTHVGRGIVGYVAQHGVPVLVPDVTKDARYECVLENTRSQMTAPLVGGESVVGVISIESHRRDAFSPSDMELLGTLASHAARVWEDAMLYQIAQQRNQQLLESYEKLREAQRRSIKQERLAALGEMAAIVAHEIRNPMTAIRGFAQRIGKQLNDSGIASKYSNIIISEVDRLDKVVKSVLDFGKKTELQKQSTRIEMIINDALLLLDDGIQRKSLIIEKYIADDLPEAMLDNSQIKQVIINLLQNAIDVTPPGDIILITAITDGADMVLNVIDNGSGVHHDAHDKMFDPFFTTKIHGTGLGLTMVRRIVEEHKGNIEAANIPGKGAAFTVRLPLNNVEAAPETETARKMDSAGQARG